MRSIARVVEVSINTESKLLADAGEACEESYGKTVRNVQSKRVQCDNSDFRPCQGEERRKGQSRSCWRRRLLDLGRNRRRHDVEIAWVVDGRDAGCGHAFTQDVAARLANRVQLTTDGHKACLEAVEAAFGAAVDCATMTSYTVRRPAQ